jgi:hypothetical protein
VQLAALGAVGAIGATALGATTTVGPRALRPTTAALVRPPAAELERFGVLPKLVERGAPVTAVVGRPRVAPAKAPVVRRPVRPRPVRPWVPTGTGMWLYQWNHSNGGSAHSIVARATRTGLSTLFVRTGSSHDGFTGAAVLRALLPATAHTNLHVVAWDFPELNHPVHDAMRLAHAAWYDRARGLHVAAVAPDIETPAEGTHTTVVGVRTYLKTLRRLLPKDVGILTAVPWPSHERQGHYPFWTTAHYSDAILPMAYWYNNPPQLVTSRSIAFLRQFHKPIEPVGQGYDGRLDVPWVPHNNLRVQVPAFLRTARAWNVPAVSLWSWQSAPPVAWSALAQARRWF